MTKDVFFSFGNTQIRASNIKSYGLAGSREISLLQEKIAEGEMHIQKLEEEKYGEPYIEDTSGKFGPAIRSAFKHVIKLKAAEVKSLPSKMPYIISLKFMRIELRNMLSKGDPLYMFVTTYQGDNHKRRGTVAELDALKSDLDTAVTVHKSKQ